MSTNEELVRKADMALADLATAGKLNPIQTDRFIRTLIDQPTMLQSVRTVAMSGPEMKLNKIGFGSRILRPAVASTALALNDRSKPDLGQITLNTKEVIAEIRLPYSVIEDNIEGGNVGGAMQQGAGGIHQTIIDLIAERAALDLEELGIMGDTASGDPYLALANGWLKLATSNIVDATGTPFSKALVKAAVKAMPDKYLRNRSALKHFVSVDNETEMRDIYGNRETAMGDSQIQGNLPLYVFGSQVGGVPLMPGTNALFGNPMNYIFGVQRNVQIEYDKDIRTREFIIVLTARVAFEIEEQAASVKYINLG
jgi:hypothetical protein